MARSEPDFVGVVVAAGQAARFGGPLPKQYADLAGRTVLERSVGLLAERPAVRGVVVVLATNELAGPRAETIRRRPGVLQVVPGGRTRADSVLHGVRAARPSPFLLVHDAARPMATPELVDAVIEATRRYGAAIPLLEVADTVKQLEPDGGIGQTVDRHRLRLAQTPQGSKTDWLQAALERAAAAGRPVTDEAAALELDGKWVAAVPGDPRNRKITTRQDLEELRLMMNPRETSLRVGSGFDIHRSGADRPLVLGGVTFAGEPGLVGHSDADVVLHAAMDALLGAAAMGDIGRLFPPSDSRYKDIASTSLARDVAGRLAEAGYAIANLDLTLLAERPKIGPRADEMRRAIAECLGTEPGRVGLKATTLERLGALGRGEGIACEAVALLRRERERP